jgi:hypothetical protein
MLGPMLGAGASVYLAGPQARGEAVEQPQPVFGLRARIGQPAAGRRDGLHTVDREFDRGGRAVASAAARAQQQPLPGAALRQRAADVVPGGELGPWRSVSRSALRRRARGEALRFGQQAFDRMQADAQIVDLRRQVERGRNCSGARCGRADRAARRSSARGRAHSKPEALQEAVTGRSNNCASVRRPSTPSVAGSRHPGQQRRRQ